MEEDSIYCSYNLSWLFWEPFAKEHTLNLSFLFFFLISCFLAVAAGRYIFDVSENRLVSTFAWRLPYLEISSQQHPSCSVDSSPWLAGDVPDVASSREIKLGLVAG